MWTTDIGDEFGDVRPLDQARIQRLSTNGVHLVGLMDSHNAFVTELAKPGVQCITMPQREHLMNILQPRDRNNKLLELLTRRSVADFQQFAKVLSKEQSFLVPFLLRDGGETSFSFVSF